MNANTRESISLHLWMDHLYPGYIEILPKIVHGLLLWFRTLSNNANINSITHLKDHAARLQYALRSIRRCKFHCDECYESFGCENSSEMLCFSKCWLITGSQQKAGQTIHQKFWMTERSDYRCCGCHKNLVYQLSYTRNNHRPVKKESASMKTCAVLWGCKVAMHVSHAAMPLHWNHNWQAKRVTRHN